MWWLDPGKDVLNVLFNRILAPYVENLDMNQVNYGIGQGQITLRNLRLKKGALDKFRLPVDVLEGYLGKFTLSLHWMNLGNQPVEILVEDVYLLVVPSSQGSIDPEEEEQRAQAAKMERLANAELLHMHGQAESIDNSAQSKGLWDSLTAKIINNIQVTVRNIHARYEDNSSVPGHPFAAGITLAGFTAVSVNEMWEPAFIESSAGAIHKLAKLQSLAVYFDTDSQTMAGLPPAEAIKRFTELISQGNDDKDHQFILRPVSGEGRVVMHHKLDKDTPRFDAQLIFDEIAVALDDAQYRDTISLVDMYHVYLRQHQYRKYRQSEEQFAANPAKARLLFAGAAILDGIRERKHQWSWSRFAERRDDRNVYVDLFQKKRLNTLSATDSQTLQALEKKLSYEDIRFYRSIARSRLRKDLALRKKLEEENKTQAPPAQGWTSWLWGTASSQRALSSGDLGFGGTMTAEQRKELYAALDYDEKTALLDDLQAPRDALKARITAKLSQGSFTLRTDPHAACKDVVSIIFTSFQADVIQRPDNLEASVALGGLSVVDGTAPNSLYPQIVQVKNSSSVKPGQPSSETAQDDPFFFVKFESNPLDERADTALTVRMRHMEIIYHKRFVEVVYAFFKPPASQLESMEALLTVATETLDSLRKDTRAGLENALQTHKTVDLQMDMNAPIIIIPEDITTNNCKHLVVDAGHIAIESDLADKQAVLEIQTKRKQQYSDEDYKKLESLMYDKINLRLEAAQFVIGNDLQSCREALLSDSGDSLHLMERTNISLQVQNSIVPSVVSLARVKVSGELPTLQVNVSDMKYKSLMRLIDVCIPRLNDDGAAEISAPLAQPKTRSDSFSLLPPKLFSRTEEYYVEDEGDETGDTSTLAEEQYFEAEDGSAQNAHHHQHNLEFNFQVHRLCTSLSKANGTNTERRLGDVIFERFALAFAQAKYDMKVGIKLRSVSMDLIQRTTEPMKFVSSAECGSQADKDLLSVVYERVDKASPEFLTTYDGVDQSVDIQISTFIFRVAPEPILDLYDFIMTTFVPQPNVTDVQIRDVPREPSKPVASSDGKILVKVNLASVQVMLINSQISIATLSLSTANVALLLRPNTMRITGRLGSLSLNNDSKEYVVLSEFNQMISIEGDDFAEFRYQTFDPKDQGYAGIKSSVYFNAASVKFQFLERPLHDIYMFVVKLAKLKGLYDAATQAAVQKASEIERMQFEVGIQSPILVFPSNPAVSQDVLVMRLGAICAQNKYEGNVSNISGTLSGIQLTSTIHGDGVPLALKIIDDITITTQITQTAGVDRSRDKDFPETQIVVSISDIKLHLTQVQYTLIMKLAQSIPLVMAGTPDGSVVVEPTPAPSAPFPTTHGRSVDLEPEIRAVANGSQTWTAIDLKLAVNLVTLHLYDASTARESDLKEHGIAKFVLNDTSLRLKMLTDGATEAQLILKSFTMSNTRHGNSKFREIIPAAQHDRNQFMLLYTMSGGQGGSALAILAVDSPQIILALDPIFALLAFFTAPAQSPPQSEVTLNQSSSHSSRPQSSTVDFRVDLHEVSVCVLEDETDSNSSSIKLSVSEISLSQQGILALTVSRLGMSLMHMGKPSEDVRFLDDVDLTLSLDSRASSAQQMTNIEIAVKPVVFRASYRDINIITSIINKALSLHGDLQKERLPTQSGDSAGKSLSSKVSQSQLELPSSTTGNPSQQAAAGNAMAMMSKEQLKGTFEGFRLILIGDLYEQPMLHLQVKPCVARAHDWSSELHATTTMQTQIGYWNLTNSHWEPLIDPWTFTVSIASESTQGGMNVKLSSRERLDLNISTTFAELAISTLDMWGKEGERVLKKGRGSYAPYRIRNRTGSPVCIWSNVDGSGSGAKREPEAVQIANEEDIDWRFDDWRTMRESASFAQHSVAVQFVGKSWEPLGGIPVDREGEYTFPLRSHTEKYSIRLLCEVKVENNVKVVTIRSTYKIENHTFYPVELTLVSDTGQPISSLEKIAPGQDYSLPLGAVGQNRIKLQPDQGFGYKWSPAIRCEELTKRGFTIRCPHSDPKEAAFCFQAWVETGLNDDLPRVPRFNLKLRAPIELENLLPYDIQYRIYDKNTDQNWRSFLRKGGVMPVHSVELGHLVLLSIEVQDTVFKPSDFAIISTDRHSDFDIENRLSLRDPQERKLDLKLNYIRYPDSGGVFKVQVYSPYLVINKTGLPFAVKSFRSNRAGSPQDVAGDTKIDVLSKTTPFLLSHPQDRGHEYIFKIGDSTWSKMLSFEAPAAETRLVLPSQTQKLEELHIGLSWTEGLGKYKLTKVITLAPRFLVKNNLSEAISFREHGVPPRDDSVIGPGQRYPLYVTRVGKEKLLTVAYTGLNAQWSPPINLEDIGSVYLRLRKSDTDQSMHLIRADLRIEGSTIFVNFFYANESWPFTIENNSDYDVTLCQTDRNKAESDVAAKSKAMYQLKAHSSMSYAWDYPAAREKKILLIINGSRRAVDMNEIGDLVPFKFTDGQRSRAISLDVRVEVHKQVLRITNYNPEFSLYKMKYRHSGSVMRQETSGSGVEVFEAVSEEVNPSISFSIELAGIGISLVNRKLVEVIDISLENLKFEYTNSVVAQTVNLACGTLQIDNQLHEALYPVVLQPTPIARESNTVAALPTVQGSVIWLKDQEHGVTFIKYCSILLQALTIETDEDLLFAIYDLTKIKGVSWEDEAANVLIQDPEDIPEPRDTAAGADLYFEVLELQPIKLSLSFMRTERVNSDEKLSIRNPLAVVVNALTMTLGNINDAPLELNALAIKDMRLTLPELQSRITYHYRQDVLRQLYRILGSADFIGNPVGLFTNVSSGVADIFYEPFNGVVMHGNKELGIGIAKGAASFVKKTVFGVTDSMTKFTSSVGKGLSAATFDSEYQARRRMTQRRNRPRHAIYGVTAGGEAFATSMASAVEGVVMKPIEGAESGGALGFFKGVGKGLVGVVTKPVVGVFDLASNVTEGIRNTTTVFDGPERDRVRLPRLIPADGIMRPYSAREALGQYWMKDLENGAYRRETYAAHIDTPMPGGDNVVLLTSSRVLSFWSKKLRLEWELPFADVQKVTTEDTGIHFTVKAGKGHNQFVVIGDRESRSWFFEEVGSVVKAFNVRRRMDAV